MSRKIKSIEAIGARYQKVLEAVGIVSAADLLDAGASRVGRQHLADKTGISERLILKWINLADLLRIKGVAVQYAELLEAAGVDTTKELRNRNAENLTVKLEEVNAARQMVRQTPSLKTVAKWIQQAKALPPIVTY